LPPTGLQWSSPRRSDLSEEVVTATQRKKTRSPRGSSKATDPFAIEEVPLYYQLGTVLREMILSGRYARGQKIPTEAELVEEYGLSRITVRQSLGILEEEGLISRKVGRGTYVADELPARPDPELRGTLDNLAPEGQKTTAKLLDLRTVSAGARDAELLGVAQGDPLVSCTRVRYRGSEPFGLLAHLLPEELGKKLSRAYLRKGSVRGFLEEKLGLRLSETEQAVLATLADATLARVLSTRVGGPLLLVRRVLYTGDGRAVECLRSYYRGESYALDADLTRDDSPTGAGRGWTLRRSRS
jgi:GntR family transcriptional regulator